MQCHVASTVIMECRREIDSAVKSSRRAPRICPDVLEIMDIAYLGNQYEGSRSDKCFKLTKGGSIITVRREKHHYHYKEPEIECRPEGGIFLYICLARTLAGAISRYLPKEAWQCSSNTLTGRHRGQWALGSPLPQVELQGPKSPAAGVNWYVLSSGWRRI